MKRFPGRNMRSLTELVLGRDKFRTALCCSVVGMLLTLLFLSSCHYTRPDLTSEELSEKTKDSLNYLYDRHYTWNTNLGSNHRLGNNGVPAHQGHLHRIV